MSARSLTACVMYTLSLLVFSNARAAIQLNDNPTAGLGVQNFRISPDSMRVVYTAEMNTADISELFSAPIDLPGMQIQLSDMPVLDGEVSGGIELTPNGSTIVYTGDLEVDQQFELFSASTTSVGSQVKLNNTPAHLEIVTNQYKFTPAGTHVIYRSDLDVDNAFELYIATIGVAGSQIRLTNTPVLDGDVSVNDYFPTTDGTRVVYLGDLDNDTVDELYSAPTNAAGMQIKLNTVSAINGSIDDDFLLTADGTRVIYRGALETPLRNELYSAPTNNSGMQIKLSGATVAGFSGVNSVFRLTPDGSRVMYTGVLDTAGVTELYSAPTDAAGMQIKLNDTPVADGDVAGRDITADGNRAVYTGDLLVNDQTDLFSAPIDAENGQIQLNTNPAGGDVTLFRLTADGSRAVYSGDMDVLSRRELYSAPTNAESLQLTLTTNPLGDDGGIGNFFLSPDGTRVVYTGVFTTAGIFDLYVASTTAEGTQAGLTNLGVGTNVLNPTFSPDSQFVVFGLDTDGDFAQDVLFAADALGQNPAYQISDPLIPGGRITQFLIAPDSQTVVYRANQDDLTVFNFSAADLTSQVGLPGDYNNNSSVENADLTLLLNNWAAPVPPTPSGWTGTPLTAPAVDNDELTALLNNWGNTIGAGNSSTAAVPEPVTMMLIVLAAISWNVLRRRAS